MASPDTRIRWTDCESHLWESMGFGLLNDNNVTSLSFGQTHLVTSSLASIQLSQCNALLTVAFPNLTTISFTELFIHANSALTSISLPNLATNAAGGANSFHITGNPLLTTISVPNWLPDATDASFTAFDFTNNALSQATVDQILARFIANPACTFSFILLDGGTNSPPGAQGLIDKADLQTRGCVVNTN